MRLVHATTTLAPSDALAVALVVGRLCSSHLVIQILEARDRGVVLAALLMARAVRLLLEEGGAFRSVVPIRRQAHLSFSLLGALVDLDYVLSDSDVLMELVRDLGRHRLLAEIRRRLLDPWVALRFARIA